MTKDPCAEEFPKISISDPLYRFLSQRLKLRLVHLMLALIGINIVRSLIIPFIHHARMNHNLFAEPGSKDFHSWLTSFIVQPIVLYTYWRSVDLIPQIFCSLHNDRVIRTKPGKTIAGFAHSLEAQMSSKLAKYLVFFGALFALVIFEIGWHADYTYRFPYGPYGAYPYNLAQQILIETPHGFILYNFFGWAAWRLWIYISYMPKLWDTFEVKVEPYHSDGAGGLRAIGDSTLQIGLLVGALLLFMAPMFVIGIESDRYDLVATLVVTTVVVVLIAPVAFLIPIWSTHKVMLSWRNHHLDSLGRQLSTRWHEVHSGKDKVTEEQVKELASLIQLRELDRKTVPVWPFRLSTVLRYFIRVAAPFAVSKLVPALAPFIKL